MKVYCFISAAWPRLSDRRNSKTGRMWLLSWKLENKFKLRRVVSFLLKLKPPVSFLNAFQIQMMLWQGKNHDFKSYFTFTSGDNWLGNEVEGMVRYAYTTFSPCPWWPKGCVCPQKMHKALRALGTLKEEPWWNFYGQGPVWTTHGMCCCPWCVVTTVLLREPKCLIVGWMEIPDSTWNPQ